MHTPVLKNEVIELLEIQKQGRYVDGTLGMGGHAQAILERLGHEGRLLGLEVDSAALRIAKDRLQPFEDQTITRQVNFRGLQGVLDELGWQEVQGMIVDLGISSAQLDDPARGFSFLAPGPLDMRMDPSHGESALNLLRRMTERDLVDVLTTYGEGRHARRLARYLLKDVAAGKIETTTDLAQFCERVLGRHGRTHPATRVFLALRALVNQEIEALKILLETAPARLAPKGRLGIISFHSLEDREVKQAFLKYEKEGTAGRVYRRVTRKPVCPSDSEVTVNPRARSAKLRILERVA